jgi:hypothetical protein
MAYFNHAFKKTFLGTGNSYSDGGQVFTDPVTGGSYTINSDRGYLTTNNVPTYMLNEMSNYQKQYPYSSPADLSTWTSGYFGLFDAKTNLSLRSPEDCCNLYIAGSAIYTNDKIGPFHGGYTETNKSKMINPRYVQQFYYVDSCAPQNEVIHVGSTFWTAGGGVNAGSITTPGVGYANTTIAQLVTTTTSGAGTGLTLFITVAAGVPTVTGIGSLGKGYEIGDTVTIADWDGTAPGTLAVYTISDVNRPGTNYIVTAGNCCKEFLCGETYYLRVDIKGSPALRFLNHNAYYTAEAYTGCCTDPIAPSAVDSTEVMILWANALLRYELTAPFLQIVIQDETGKLWYAPGSPAAEVAALGGDTWDNYVSTGHIADACAGMIINGAYVDTKFGDCTFQLTDFYEKQPVKLYASEVDYNGDPCAFEGICAVIECEGTQAQGLGEQILRDVVLSESYRQNFLANNDLRIREITQGNQLVTAINRNALYAKYYLLHSVPRFNNPSGTFDNDRYLLEIVMWDRNTTFEDAVNNWLQGCNVNCAFEEFLCITDCSSITFPATPQVTNPYGTPRGI